jgi:hypothetical protein
MSVYDEVQIGPLTISPNMVNADYVHVELLVRDGDPQPCVEDGAVYLPLRVWERVQEATREAV